MTLLAFIHTWASTFIIAAALADNIKLTKPITGSVNPGGGGLQCETDMLDTVTHSFVR